jgi:hypothetical protein
MPVQLTTVWRCLDPECPAGTASGAQGPAAAEDKAAEKHTKSAGHATEVVTRP